MKESRKMFIVSALLAVVGTNLMREVQDATISETIGFILLIIGLVGIGIFIKTAQDEEKERNKDVN